jgi:branched-chain amino acid transport system substrate-binding protein
MTSRRAVLAGAAALPALALRRPARAATTVRIGALYPLTGNAAASGQEAREAIAFGADLVNRGAPELSEIAVVAHGMSNGLTIEPVFTDHRGDPSVAQSEALRLITREHVAALLGAYQSSAALTSTAVAERYGVPYVVADSVATNITARGFKSVFRVTPIAINFGETYMRFLAGMKQQGRTIAPLAIVNENTDYGSSVGDAIEAAAREAGVPVAVRIPYSANSADVSAQVLQLKSAAPAVAIFISYPSDAILFMKAMRSLDYHPPMVIGDSAGFADPAFIPSVGAIAQGAISRSAWSLGQPGSLSYRIAAMFRARTGHGFSDVTARVMEAFLVLADGINRAGSADPAAIAAALRQTQLGPEQMIVGYRGVRFDATGQNVESATYLTQLQGDEFATVWPEASATAKITWPMTGWKG